MEPVPGMTSTVLASLVQRASAMWIGALLLAMNVFAAVPWHHPLYLANEGYWRQRVAVSFENPTDSAIAGAPVGVRVPALTGVKVASLRVCRADGVELLFDVRDANGDAKRGGPLASTDTVMFPADCAAHSNATVFVYAGNETAWAVPDYLHGTNGESSTALRLSVGPVEHLRLRRNATRFKMEPEFANRADIVARNFTTETTPALVRVNLRQALARLSGLPRDPAVRALDGEGNGAAIYRLGTGADLLIAAKLKPQTEERFHLGFNRGEGVGAGATLADYERLLSSPANLVANGSLERGDNAPDDFSKSNADKITARFSTDAKFGRRSVELIVPADAKPNWFGWQSRPIPIRAGASYLLAGWLKAVGLKSSATIHAHFHDAKGALTKSGAMASTGAGVSGDSDWTRTSAFLTAPPDAATIQLHLTMNTHGTLRHDGILLCEVVEGVLERVQSASGAAPPASQPLHVWEVNPLVKVFPDTPPHTQARAVSVELARNEFEPVQLALRGRFGAAGRVEVTISPLTNANGATLPPVKVERVGFVPIDHPSGYFTTDVPDWCRKLPRGAGRTDGWAGEWPDPLVPGREFAVETNRTQPVWLTFQTTRETASGEYRGTITVRWNGTVAVTLPLTATVLPFALPNHTRLKAIFDLRRGPGGWYGPDGRTLAEREKWLRFIAAHRLGIDSIEPPPKFSYANGKVTMDATDFDAAAKLCFDELGMNVSYTPRFFYMFGWAYPPKKLFGLEPFTPEWTSAFKQAYQLFTDHVRAKGWHEKFVFYISDEPHFEHAFVVEQMKKLCAIIHEVDREIPIYSSTWRHCAAWDDSLDLWGVGQHGSFPLAEMARLQAAGKNVWFTCDGQQATDTPYLATERMLPYYCLKYGARGFEFWGLSWWTYDPWKLGWHWFIRQSDDGKRHYWIRYPDGDGYLAYPGQPIGVDGPVSTIRLEQVREGLEDFEAMSLLTEQVAKAKRDGQSVEAGERALAMARDLVTIPNAGGLRSTEILPNPDRLPEIRRAVNAALVELMQK